MIRSMGTATIAFGLVSAPVKLHAAIGEETGGVSFNLLHADCHGRVKQMYCCPACDDVVVPREDMVKGYEIRKNEFLVFSAEELKSLDEESTNRIDVTEFVPADTVPRLYVSGTYYLSPDKNGERPYLLLAAALHKSGQSAIGQYVSRGKEKVVAVRALSRDRLVMEHLRYETEVRDVSGVPVGNTKVKPITDAELQMAVGLIEALETEAFDASKYYDRRQEAIAHAIERKDKGGAFALPSGKAEEESSTDLLAALKASLTAAKTKKPRRIAIA